jgi:hypothetical protein
MTYETDSQRKDRVAKMKELLMVREEIQQEVASTRASSNQQESSPPEINTQVLNFKDEPPDTDFQEISNDSDQKVHVSGQNTDNES